LKSDLEKLKKELIKYVGKMDETEVNRVMRFIQANLNQLILGSRLNWKYVNANTHDFVTTKKKNVELKTISSIQKKNFWFGGTMNKTNLVLIHCLPDSIDAKEHFFLVDQSKLTKKEQKYLDDGRSIRGKGYIPHGVLTPGYNTPKKIFWRAREVTFNDLKHI
jgi:3-methyladenine DNA glycosylase AlkD